MTRHKNKASLLALSAGALGLLAFHGQARAVTPEFYFYPAKAWTVSARAMEVAQAQAQSCSIGNEFNNGFVMRLNGSYDWVQSMHIDFRQDALTQGQMYEVIFSVPGQITQTVPAKAVRSNVLIMDLRQSKDLYKTLREAAVLDLNIDDNEFRFYMTGFSSAAQGFERCMAGEPAVADKAAPNAVTTNESIALEDAERRSAIVDLSSENPKPVVSSIPVTEVKKLGDAIIGSKPPKAVEEQSRPQKMTEKLAEEIEKNPDIIAYEPAPSVATETAALSAADKLMPITAVTDVAKTEARPPVMESPKVKIKKETARIEADFTTLGDVEPAGAYTDVSTLSEAEMARKISELEKMVYRLERENTALNEEIKDALEESEQERLSITSDNWNLEQATMRYNEAERQLKRIGQQLQRERVECTMEKKDLEAMLFDPQVTSQQQLARLAELERQLEAARAKLDAAGL